MTTPPSESIQNAARWLAGVPIGDRPRPIVPALVERFGLTPSEACHAIRAASSSREGSH